jgi:hypothetical protein
MLWPLRIILKEISAYDFVMRESVKYKYIIQHSLSAAEEATLGWSGRSRTSTQRNFYGDDVTKNG